jgi:hypothetical protein
VSENGVRKRKIRKTTNKKKEKRTKVKRKEQPIR